jgi:hypothetical protein
MLAGMTGSCAAPVASLGLPAHYSSPALRAPLPTCRLDVPRELLVCEAGDRGETSPLMRAQPSAATTAQPRRGLDQLTDAEHGQRLHEQRGELIIDDDLSLVGWLLRAGACRLLTAALPSGCFGSLALREGLAPVGQ